MSEVTNEQLVDDLTVLIELRDERVSGFWDADMRRVAEWVTR